MWMSVSVWWWCWMWFGVCHGVSASLLAREKPTTTKNEQRYHAQRMQPLPHPRARAIIVISSRASPRRSALPGRSRSKIDS